MQHLPDDTSRTSSELILRFARAAHRAGFPSDDLELRVEEVGRAVGEDVAISSTPTLVEIAIGSFPHQRTSTIRVTPQAVDLDLIGRLDGLAARIREHELDAPAALSELSGMEPMRRPRAIVVLAYGLAGLAVSPVLGGGWRESLAAALVGLIAGCIAVVGSRRSTAQAIVAPVAAIAASLSCALLLEAGFEISVEVATLGALVALLPGMTLTIGMRELATNHLQSGLSNAAVALVQLVGLGFGVAVGTSIAVGWFGAAPPMQPDSFGLETQVVAAAIAGLAFTVTLNAQRRDAVWACGAAVLAIVANAAAGPIVGDTAAVFVAALVIGLVGNAFAMLRHQSALVFIVPGVLMLVPGSLGYESAARLLADDTIEGIEGMFDTIVVALSIVYGLIVSTVLLPDRRASSSATRFGEITS